MKHQANTFTNTVRHYRRQPDGSIRFVGTEEVVYRDLEPLGDVYAERRREIALRDAADRVRTARECADFEDLVDAADEVINLSTVIYND